MALSRQKGVGYHVAEAVGSYRSRPPGPGVGRAAQGVAVQLRLPGRRGGAGAGHVLRGQGAQALHGGNPLHRPGCQGQVQLPGLGRAQAPLQAHRFPGSLRAGARCRVPQQAHHGAAGGGGGLGPLFWSRVERLVVQSHRTPSAFADTAPPGSSALVFSTRGLLLELKAPAPQKRFARAFLVINVVVYLINYVRNSNRLPSALKQ